METVKNLPNREYGLFFETFNKLLSRIDLNKIENKVLFTIFN